jgi:guanylate kinase
VQGARQLRSSGAMDAQYTFILPPSTEELEKRLRGRGTEREEDIRRRLDNATGEIEEAQQSDLYDVFIVNKLVKDSVAMFEALVEQNRRLCLATQLHASHDTTNN